MNRRIFWLKILFYIVIGIASNYAATEILPGGTLSGKFLLGFIIFWVITDLFEIRCKL